MEDQLYYSRVTCPPVIVVKEEPIWKLAKKDGTVQDIICVTDEEPELEWAVCKDVDIGEDPLLMSDTEESSLSIENSVSSRSNDGKNSERSCLIKKEKIHVADISQLNDGNVSEEDNDSLDLEVAELLKRNNELFNGFKKEDKKLKANEKIEDNKKLYNDCDEVINLDESLGNDETNATDERQFKSIFQSFFKKELSPNINLNKINKINDKNIKRKSNSRSLLKKNNYTQIDNEEVERKNRSQIYSLRTGRPILKRYSPVDFNETINRTFKKSKNSGNSSASFNNKEMIREIKLKLEKMNEIRQKDAIKSCNSEVKREEINIKNRSQIYSLRKSRPVKKRYSPVDFNEIKTNNDHPFNKDIINYINEIRQKDAVNGKLNIDKTLHDIEFDYYVNKRHWHNKLEKHRRTLLSELFSNLSNEFPSKLRLSNKMPKVNILNKAVEYINELKHREEYLIKTTNALKEKQKLLQEKLETLKKKKSKTINFK